MTTKEESLFSKKITIKTFDKQIINVTNDISANNYGYITDSIRKFITKSSPNLKFEKKYCTLNQLQKFEYQLFIITNNTSHILYDIENSGKIYGSLSVEYNKENCTNDECFIVVNITVKNSHTQSNQIFDEFVTNISEKLGELEYGPILK
jgi:hypothetical protein